MTEIPKRVLVAVPTLSGQITHEIHAYMSSLGQRAMAGLVPFGVHEFIAYGYSPVHFARNIICGYALHLKVDAVLMIDADMLPTETVDRLLFSPAHIAAARMFRFRHNGHVGARPPEIAACATLVRDGQRYDIVPRADVEGGPVKVNGCGTGCTMIRREVLEDPRMRCGPDDTEFDEVDFPVPSLFKMDYSPAGRITEWEDVDFSLRADALGYDVVCDFGARCGHRKAINLDAVAELYRNPSAPTLAPEEIAK